MTVASEQSPADSAGEPATREIVHLVPHTHWDREWYLPWQRFRMRLVELVDGLLDEMAVDDRVRFTLDGQTATVDDYLEIRPERERDLMALVADGRLAVGPWRILMDEFLVSGETLVRNLEMGVRRAAELGRAMEIGYLPDMFGHIAQMPQILRRAGIADAVVWRGVPAAIDQHAFTWRAPDGSAVRCEYLLGGYGNGREVLALADRIGAKLDVFVALQRPAFGGDEMLAMYGEDHSIPRAGYADLVAAFNASQDRFEIRIETLAEAITATRDPADPEQSWDGELRSSARANVLMGVTSHRIEVKQAAGRVERLLERAVEPLWSLHGASWPAAFLDEAWRRVVENSAHDSICACSAEATVAQVLVRYAEAEQIATGLLDRLLAELGSGVARGSNVVANPSPFDRAALIALDVALPVVGEAGPVTVRDGAGATVPIQPDGVTRLVVREATMAAADIDGYLRRRLHGRELFGLQVNGYRIVGSAVEGGPRVTIDVDLTPDPEELDVDELLDALAAETALAPDARWLVSVVSRRRLRLLAQPTVPGLGWTTVAPGGREGAGANASHPVRAIDAGLANGLVSVTVRPDGTLEIAAGEVVLTGVGRIVDGGDVGDSYNYAPPPHDTIVEAAASVDVVTGRSGPLLGDLTVHRTYEWPAALLDDLSARTEETVATGVDMTVELRAGEPFVRITVAIDNRSVDHRVRFHLPIPGGADRSRAEGQFAIVERGLEMEGGHGERPLPTFPAHGFVVAGTVAALLEHVTEYELVGSGGRGDAATELALTLVRATGLISRADHPYRDDPAGPGVAAPTGQAQGRRTVAFALLPLVAGRGDAAILRAADAFRHPFLVGPGSGRSGADAAGGGLRIDGDAVVLSSLRTRAAGDDVVRELRLVREAPGDGIAVVSGPFDRTRNVDILGRPLDDWRTTSGRFELRLGGWEVRTVQLAAGAAAEG